METFEDEFVVFQLRRCEHSSVEEMENEVVEAPRGERDREEIEATEEGEYGG